MNSKTHNILLLLQGSEDPCVKYGVWCLGGGAVTLLSPWGLRFKKTRMEVALGQMQKKRLEVQRQTIDSGATERAVELGSRTHSLIH